jgi:hypothetical protein
LKLGSQFKLRHASTNLYLHYESGERLKELYDQYVVSCKSDDGKNSIWTIANAYI